MAAPARRDDLLGSDGATRQLQEVSAAFQAAHEMGCHDPLVLHAEPGLQAGQGLPRVGRPDRQANHLGVTLEADIIKQKLPENNAATSRSRTTARPTRRSTASWSRSPIEWTRWQVVNCYMGRIGLINSGGASARTTCRTRSRPPSSTSAPAGWADLGPEGVPEAAAEGSSCCTRSRTSTCARGDGA